MAKEAGDGFDFCNLELNKVITKWLEIGKYTLLNFLARELQPLKGYQGFEGILD